MISTFTHRYDHFFHQETSPHLLAIVRIALGLFVMLYWYTQWSFARLFSTDGIFFPLVQMSDPISFFLLHPPLWFMHSFFALVFLFLTFFTVGFRTRTSAFVILMAFAYFHFLSQWQMMTSFYRLFCFSFVVFLIPGGDRAFSVAMWQKHGSLFAWEPVSIFSQRLLSFQVTATYFCVSWQKLLIPEWFSGGMLLQGFTGRWATPVGFWLARTLSPRVIDAMLLVSIFGECLMPFMFWIRRLQPFAFIFGFLFHTMITFTLNIWEFQFLVPLYIVFLRPDEIFEFCRRRSRGRISVHPAMPA